ncbi:hypothetical protein NMG60_11034669 [Bertholletia excelsa]
MSTTTRMMSNHHRRFVTPSCVGPLSNNKRKERDGFREVPKPSIKKPTRPIGPNIPRVVPSRPALVPKPTQPTPNNLVLAGYLAHEFLTKGTLFGEQWDPARAEAVPVSAAQTEQRRLKQQQQPPPSSPGRKIKAETSSRPEEHRTEERHRRYVEVTDLIRNSGAHIPGIVNPTQLARFLHL